MRDTLPTDPEAASEPDVCCASDGCTAASPLTDDVACCSKAFKALSHPVRLGIMNLLRRSGGHVCVCDIERQFDLSQPTISHHLRLLREAGLVESEQRGPWVHYSVRRDELDVLMRHIAALAD